MTKTPAVTNVHETMLSTVKSFGGVILLLALMLASVAAQTVTSFSPTNGSTPVGLAPGTPAGSYPLSGFDTLNPYSGTLNFRLPLLQIGGRGSAGYTMTLPIERKWRINKTVTDTRIGCERCEEHFVKYQISASADWWHPQSPQEMLGPGRMYARGSGHNLVSGCYSDTQNWQYTLTRLTFTAPDGTEYEFRDKLSGGRPLPIQTCAYGPSRGYEFVTADGTSATFVSDHKIDDYILPAMEGSYRTVSGHLLMRDGTRYRIDDGNVSWIRDRNGNTVRFLPGKIIDSLNREVTITGSYDPVGMTSSQLIKFNGFNGAQRQIRIVYSSLAHALLPANEEHPAETIMSFGDLFPGITDWGEYGPGGDFHTQVISAVVLPDGRSYRFFYNSYAELARVELPTGGAFEYDWTGWVTGGGGSFETGPNYDVTRQVLAKRTYNEAGVLQSKLTIGGCPDTMPMTQSCRQVDQTDPKNRNRLLERTKHFYYGVGGSGPLEDTYPHWLEGKEFKTEMIGSDGVSVARRVETNWAQRAPLLGWPTGPEPENDPRIVDTITTLVDSGQVAKRSAINPVTQAVGFDQFNNPTDVWEFGFGPGASGTLIRHTHTDYVTSASYIGTNQTAIHNGTAAHLRGLPLRQWVSSDIDGSNKKSLTTYEYDNYEQYPYPQDQAHSPLIGRANISGLCTTFTFGACSNESPISYYTRGNLTSVTSYTNAATQTGPVTVAMQYDVAGNMIKFFDARSIATQQYYATTANYADSFGMPDGEARTDTSVRDAPELASRSQRSYAFATSVTNRLGTVYSQFSYYLGGVIDAEDANGIAASGYYDDPLDRPTQVITAANIPAFRRQTSFGYHNPERTVTVTSDLGVYQDNRLKSEIVYDGLGRTTETRAYEDGSGFITTRKFYDGLGRVVRTTNPFRTTSDPTYGETLTKYDLLGRVVEARTTEDSAKVLTSYAGNTVTVTDPVGRQKKTVMDALGRLEKVFEAPNFADYNYETRYQYDVLGNLTKVIQGAQDGTNDQIRTFIYDGLSRLTSSTNPESGAAMNPGGTTSYQYDPNGNLEVKTNPRLGHDGTTHYKIYYYYDPLNRLTRRIYNDGTPEVNYYYDAQTLPAGAPALARGASIGHLLAVTYGGTTSINGTYSGYDSIGRTVKSAQVTDGQTFPTMEYVYDLSGAMTQQKYPSGREVTTVYDHVGRLESASGQKLGETAKTYLSQPEYAAHGSTTALKLGNGLWERTSFNSRLQPIEIKLGTQSNQESILKLNYSYGTADNNGNVHSQRITAPGMTPLTQTYTYDGVNRLQVAKETGGPNPWQQYFGYDRFGNRRFIPEGTNLPAGLEDPNNQPFLNPQISPANNRLFGYRYDLGGNVTMDMTNRTFEYDGENRMVRFNGGANPTTGGADYSYDGEGQRVKKVTMAGKTLFIYNSAGHLVAEYTTVEVEKNGTSYFTSDMLGTPRVITGRDGQVKSRHDYLPFGEELHAGFGGRTEQQGYVADTVRQKFTGKERDSETGLDFFVARYYASSQGRFTTVDPLGTSGFADTPQSWNRYAYGYNNPLRFTDPSGKVPGDFYNDDGNKIGSDGKNDGKLYFVTSKQQAKAVEKADKQGGTTQVSAVSSALELPSYDVRQEIGVNAVQRSNSPAGNDTQGGFHEEGGIVIPTAQGQLAVPANPGPVTDPRGTTPASVEVFNSADPSQLNGLSDPNANVDTTYHVHPAGTAQTTTDSSSSGGGNHVIGSTRTTNSVFEEGPSPADFKFAAQVPTRLRYHIIVGARDKKVYFYNSKVVGKMPLNKFTSIR